MITCARCDQIIDAGQLYTQARHRTTSDAPGVADPIVHLHDQCPMNVETRDGRMLVNGIDYGPAPMLTNPSDDAGIIDA